MSLLQQIDIRGINVKGYWSDRWIPVLEVFADNFLVRGDQGAGVAVYCGGKLALHLWAGEYTNQASGVEQAPWDENTCVNIFSAGKGLVALCVLQLVSQGHLDLDAPVANYWPEFAAQDKSHITVRQILCHRSGLSAFHERVADSDFFSAATMVARIEQESPWWPSDTEQGYSPFIFGWILAELVRRVSGYASFDDYFQEQVARVAEFGFYFGVPDIALSRIADTRALKKLHEVSVYSDGADSLSLGKLMKADPRGVTNRAFSNPISMMTSANSLEWRRAQIPAANAHATARSVAAIYGNLAHSACADSSEFQPLLAQNYLPLCWQTQSFEQDRVLGLPLRFSCGFMLSQPERRDCRYGTGMRGFGHPGAGGSVGFADPDADLGFGYVTQRMGQGLLIDERAQYLIEAVYRVLGGDNQHE